MYVWSINLICLYMYIHICTYIYIYIYIYVRIQQLSAKLQPNRLEKLLKGLNRLDGFLAQHLTRFVWKNWKLTIDVTSQHWYRHTVSYSRETNQSNKSGFFKYHLTCDNSCLSHVIKLRFKMLEYHGWCHGAVLGIQCLWSNGFGGRPGDAVDALLGLKCHVTLDGSVPNVKIWYLYNAIVCNKLQYICLLMYSWFILYLI